MSDVEQAGGGGSDAVPEGSQDLGDKSDGKSKNDKNVLSGDKFNDSSEVEQLRALLNSRRSSGFQQPPSTSSRLCKVSCSCTRTMDGLKIIQIVLLILMFVCSATYAIIAFIKMQTRTPEEEFNRS